MCIKDPINKTCWKNDKDLSNGAPNIKLWNHTKKTHFLVVAKNFRRPCMKLKIFFCQFPNPWTLRVSGMGGYTSKCEKSKNHCTLLSSPACLYLYKAMPVQPVFVLCKAHDHPAGKGHHLLSISGNKEIWVEKDVFGSRLCMWKLFFLQYSHKKFS